MTFLLIFPLLMTAFAIGGLFDGGHAESKPETVPDPDPPMPGTLLELSTTSAPLLNGTEGDDTLVSSDFRGGTSTDEVNLGGGDDIAIVSFESVEINGGDGNDTLLSTNAGTILDGGAGDDELSAGDYATLLGGDGDDVLTYDDGFHGSSNASSLDGGAGNDTLVFHDNIGSESAVSGGAGMTGGDGADTFFYDLTLVDGTPSFTDPDADIIRNSVGSVSDFNPDEDRLIIDLDRAAGSEDRDVTSIELDEYDYMAGGTRVVGTNVVFNIEAGTDGNPVQVTLSLPGAVGVTMNHIELRGFELQAA